MLAHLRKCARAFPVCSYAYLLTLMFLLDRKQYEQVGAAARALSLPWHDVAFRSLSWHDVAFLSLSGDDVASGAVCGHCWICGSRPGTISPCHLRPGHDQQCTSPNIRPHRPPAPPCSPGIHLQAQAVAGAAVERLSGLNRRTLDVLGARIYSYLSLAHERMGGWLRALFWGMAEGGG